MRQGRVDTTLLDKLLIAKGLTRKSLETELHFTETQVKSWFSTERRPQDGDALRIAHWLEVPPEVLCGLPLAEYADLSVAQIASKASFDRFCKSDSRVRGPVRDILEQYADAPGAPKRSSEWSILYEKVFVPATYLGHQQEKEARKMMQRTSGRRGKGKDS